MRVEVLEVVPVDKQEQSGDSVVPFHRRCATMNRLIRTSGAGASLMLPVLREKGKCIPIEDPSPPLINYSGYSSPITRAQFEKLLKPQVNADSRR